MEELIFRAKSGDKEAFGLLSELIRPKLLSHIIYHVRNKDMAENIIQQTFYKALKKIDSVQDGKFYFNAWLYTIAGNLIRDERRKMISQNTYSLEARIALTNENVDLDHAEDFGVVMMNSVLDNSVLDPAMIYEHEEERAETHDRLMAAMQLLTPVQRETLVRRSNGETYVEIGESIGISWQSVKGILEKVRKIVRDAY
jgi:RNA polymerase sigma-70 factor (ECF subfamily)